MQRRMRSWGASVLWKKTVSRWVRTKLIELVDVATTALRPRAFAWRETCKLRVHKSEGDQRRRPNGAKFDSIMCTASLMKVSREGLERKLRLRVA